MQHTQKFYVIRINYFFNRYTGVKDLNVRKKKSRRHIQNDQYIFFRFIIIFEVDAQLLIKR